MYVHFILSILFFISKKLSSYVFKTKLFFHSFFFLYTIILLLSSYWHTSILLTEVSILLQGVFTASCLHGLHCISYGSDQQYTLVIYDSLEIQKVLLFLCFFFFWAICRLSKDSKLHRYIRFKQSPPKARGNKFLMDYSQTANTPVYPWSFPYQGKSCFLQNSFFESRAYWKI